MRKERKSYTVQEKVFLLKRSFQIGRQGPICMTITPCNQRYLLYRALG